MSPQRLFNHYIPPYKAGLDAGSGAVMVALNSRNGTPATSDSWLLKDVLRDQWGFKGLTVSDHGALQELITHGTAADPEDAVRVALKTGINMSMSDVYYSTYLPGLIICCEVTMEELVVAARLVLNVKINMSMSDEYYSKYLPGLIKSGKVTMEELDDAARHVLNVKYDMGLFNERWKSWTMLPAMY